MREKRGLLLSIFIPTFVIENRGIVQYPPRRWKVHNLIYTIMSKQKVTNTTQVTTGVVKEMSETARCRETLAAIYAAQAKQIFVGVACKTFHKTDTQFVSEEDVNEVLSKVTDGGANVWVYTQPAEEPSADSGLLNVPKSWNKVLPIGQRWYKKLVAVTDAFVLLRAYTNYLRFKEDSDRVLVRSAKKIVAEMSQEELIAFILKAQKAQEADSNGKQD